jgi:hypothetical protein
LQRLALGLQHAQKLLDVNLLGESDPTKLLDVSLAPQVHTRSRSYRAIESLVPRDSIELSSQLLRHLLAAASSTSIRAIATRR